MIKVGLTEDVYDDDWKILSMVLFGEDQIFSYFVGRL